MEDFDFDFDNEVGTQIDNLKEKNNQNYTDTDLDYDKIIDNLISTQPSNNKKKTSLINWSAIVLSCLKVAAHMKRLFLRLNLHFHLLILGIQ